MTETNSANVSCEAGAFSVKLQLSELNEAGGWFSGAFSVTTGELSYEAVMMRP